MLEITLCCNRDIIPTWNIRKFVLRLTHFEMNYISALLAFYDRFVLTRKCTSVRCSN